MSSSNSTKKKVLKEFREVSGIGNGSAWGRKIEWGNGISDYSSWPSTYDHVSKRPMSDYYDTTSHNANLRAAYNEDDDETARVGKFGHYFVNGGNNAKSSVGEGYSTNEDSSRTVGGLRGEAQEFVPSPRTKF
jgi:hypothetical protein